jgi:putative selenium metabolism hydrolase
MLDFTAGLDEKGLLAFTQELIRTPSLSMNEEVIAGVVARKMRELGYDDVRTDSLFNVVGVIKGTGSGPALLFNGHTDHAGVGDMPDPFSGDIVSGEPWGVPGPVVYGRGAVDMKSAVAAMVYAGAVPKKLGLRLAGDIIVTCVAREEMAKGEGILKLLDEGLRADYAVSGEATGLDVVVGHRGKMEFKVTTIGKTTHGAFPELGVNAVYLMNDFINALRTRYVLPEHAVMGKATITVLDIMASPGALTPIVPDRCEIIIDRRYFPEETEQSLLDGIRGLFADLAAANPEFKAEAEIIKVFPPMLTDPACPVVTAIQEARKTVLGAHGPVRTWRFGVDGTFISRAGIPCVGFGPGDEHLAHTPRDCAPVDHIVACAKVYAQLAADLCAAKA